MKSPPLKILLFSHEIVVNACDEGEISQIHMIINTDARL